MWGFWLTHTVAHRSALVCAVVHNAVMDADAVLFSTAALRSRAIRCGMTTLNARAVAVSVCAVLLGVSHVASAQDLSRYREVAFGSSVSSVVAITGTKRG